MKPLGDGRVRCSAWLGRVIIQSFAKQSRNRLAEIDKRASSDDSTKIQDDRTDIPSVKLQTKEAVDDSASPDNPEKKCSKIFNFHGA